MLELSCYLWFERFRKVVKYFEMNSGGPNHRPFAVHESVKQILSRSVIVKVPRKFPWLWLLGDSELPNGPIWRVPFVVLIVKLSWPVTHEPSKIHSSPSIFSIFSSFDNMKTLVSPPAPPPSILGDFGRHITSPSTIHPELISIMVAEIKESSSAKV